MRCRCLLAWWSHCSRTQVGITWPALTAMGRRLGSKNTASKVASRSYWKPITDSEGSSDDSCGSMERSAASSQQHQHQHTGSALAAAASQHQQVAAALSRRDKKALRLAAADAAGPSTPQHQQQPLLVKHHLYYGSTFQEVREMKQRAAKASWEGRELWSSTDSPVTVRQQQLAVLPQLGDKALTRQGRLQLGALAASPQAPWLPPLQELLPESQTRVWPIHQGLPVAMYTVLAHVAQFLGPADKQVPKQLQPGWDSTVQAICRAHPDLQPDTVHHAMLLQFPLHHPSKASGLGQFHRKSYCCMLQPDLLTGHRQTQPLLSADGASTSTSRQPDDEPKYIQLKQNKGRPGYAAVHLGWKPGTKRRLPILLGAHRVVLYACVGLPKDIQEMDPVTQSDEINRRMRLYHAMHLCDNTLCVNFKHLYWGKAADNTKPSHDTYDALMERAQEDGTRRDEDEVQLPRMM